MIPSGPSADRRAVTAAAGGDREGLGELYDRHAARMLAIGLRILRDRREAEDVLHDVFVEAWRRAPDYDSTRGTVRGWLFCLMRSRALDRVRSVGRRRDALSDPQSGPLSTHFGPMPAESQRDGQVVRAALASLPEEQRAVLLLGYFEGLSCREIALQEGVPIGTVKSRVAAALTKMRQSLRCTERTQ